MVSPKKKSFAAFSTGYGSGTETETEAPPTSKPKSPKSKFPTKQKSTAKDMSPTGLASPTKPKSPKKNKNEIWAAKHGVGVKMGSSKTTAATTKKASEEPVQNVRATRSSSRQPRAAPPPSEAPPLPTSPAKATRSPVRPRGRPPVPPTTTDKPAAAQKPKSPARRTRTASPANKRLIADSPPPEVRMDPFPPKPAPMTVTDKPAVRNRYGEKVVAPVDARQRMRQAINFLSDEGVENLVDFESKLQRIKDWLDKNHPHMHGITPDHEEDPEQLCARVRYMIWVHENRIAEGAEQWFTRDQFPDSKSMYSPIKPRRGDQWRLNPDGTSVGKPEGPKNQVMLAQDREIQAKNRAEKAAAVKASPKKIAPAAAVALPPLPELPHPEVWHRKEAARFPYGETPHMEQVMSRQIVADLARGKSWYFISVAASTNSFL
jgi:hypothetical protein